MGAVLRTLVCASTQSSHDGFGRLLSGTHHLNVVGNAMSGGDALAMHRMLAPDVVAIDGAIDGRDGLRVAAALCKERPVPVLLLVDRERRAAVRAEAPDHGVHALHVVSRDLLRSRDGPASSIVRARLQLLVMTAQRPSSPATPELDPNTCMRYEVARIAEASFDSVVVLGSAGTPHLMPHLLAEARSAALPLVIAVHHNPRLSDSFREWVGELVGAEATWLEDAAVRSDARLLVARAKGGTSGTAALPDLGAVVSALVDRGRRILACVASGMTGEAFGPLGRSRRVGGQVVVLEPGACTHPTMPKAIIGAGLADAVVTPHELAWLIARAGTRQTSRAA